MYCLPHRCNGELLSRNGPQFSYNSSSSTPWQAQIHHSDSFRNYGYTVKSVKLRMHHHATRTILFFPFILLYFLSFSYFFSLCFSFSVLEKEVHSYRRSQMLTRTVREPGLWDTLGGAYSSQYRWRH